MPMNEDDELSNVFKEHNFIPLGRIKKRRYYDRNIFPSKRIEAA
jgi:hypothetical protein